MLMEENSSNVMHWEQANQPLLHGDMYNSMYAFTTLHTKFNIYKLEVETKKKILVLFKFLALFFNLLPVVSG